MTDESRDYVRVGRILEFEYTNQSIVTRARIEDISEGGVFVDTQNPLGVGTEIEFKLQMPDGGDPIVGEAVVVWRQETVGMGIEFKALSDEQRDRIKFYVAAEFFKSFSDR